MSDRPSRLLRFVYRAPVLPVRCGLGGLFRALGLPWIALTTRGRRSGRLHIVLVDCLHHDAATDRYFVQSAYGMGADWVRNALAAGRLEAALGRDRFAATLEVVPADEALVVGAAIRAAHPIYVRLMALCSGVRDLSDASLARWATSLPMLAVRRLGGSSAPSTDR